MADFASLKQTIQAYIKQNGNEEITGNILQDVLLAMVSTMGDSAINSLASALQDETMARQNQDGTLQGNITAEATARQQADTALGGRIDGLQTAINGINTKLAEGYIYVGIATPSTNPGIPSGKVFYITVSSGTYTNFSNLTVAQGINILKYNGSAWSKDVVYAVDDEPTVESANLITSGGTWKVEERALQNQLMTSDRIRLDPILHKDGYFFTETGDHSNTNFKYDKYQVRGGGIYSFGGRLGADVTIWFIYWLDSSDNVIGNAPYGYPGSEALIIYDCAVKAPEGAAYAIVNCSKFLYGVCHHFDEITNHIDSREVGSKIKSTNVLQPSSITERGFINDAGVFVSNNSLDVLNFNVTQGKAYFFTGNVSSGISGFYFIYWYDSLGNPINGSLYITTDVPSSQNQVYSLVIAPENAVTAKISRQRNYKVSFLEVADFFEGVMGIRGTLPSCDLNDVFSSGIYQLVDSNTYQHSPQNLGYLKVTFVRGWILQEFLKWTGGSYLKRQWYIDNEPTNWEEISGGNTYNNNNTFNEYSQTVSVTATPTITADTNNYLSPTGDTTDRTADILAMLNTVGICHLGAGDFYVDSIIMPNNTSIIGSGSATKVYVKSGDNKFAFRLGDQCVVKDMQILGSMTNITVSATIGTRHGILWQGNYTQSGSGDTCPKRGTLENLYILSFDGGGITCYDTGYGTRNYIEATNCHIWNCCVGINISYWSEFHKFTNIRCESCHYGCINNGGNNIFVNCDFSGSLGIAMLMDNSQGQSPNNTHGSCVGCVFNHTASNTGVGIKILNCSSGFMFTGCQIFFSKIELVDSNGIVFSACNFGQSNCDISVDGGTAITFIGNIHQNTPPSISIINTQSVRFINCYNRTTGNEVTP